MKTYTIEVKYTVSVSVEAPDEETAVMDALEVAHRKVANGDVDPLVEILSER